MSKHERDLEKYLKEAQSFDDDRLDLLRRSERRAWRVAGAGWIVAVCAVAAIAGLTPLKSVAPPVVLGHDRSTGHVDVMTSLDGVKRMTMTEIDHKYWLARYINARESYVWQDLASNSALVSLMTDPAEQNRYAREVSADNPRSPQRLLGKNSIIDIRIRSISLGSGGSSASVRFARTTRELSHNSPEDTKSYVATVTYVFAQTAMPESERLKNPWGFTVKVYRLDEENTK